MTVYYDFNKYFMTYFQTINILKFMIYLLTFIKIPNIILILNFVKFYFSLYLNFNTIYRTQE